MRHRLRHRHRLPLLFAALLLLPLALAGAALPGVASAAPVQNYYWVLISPVATTAEWNYSDFNWTTVPPPYTVPVAVNPWMDGNNAIFRAYGSTPWDLTVNISPGMVFSPPVNMLVTDVDGSYSAGTPAHTTFAGQGMMNSHIEANSVLIGHATTFRDLTLAMRAPGDLFLVDKDTLLENVRLVGAALTISGSPLKLTLSKTVIFQFVTIDSWYSGDGPSDSDYNRLVLAPGTTWEIASNSDLDFTPKVAYPGSEFSPRLVFGAGASAVVHNNSRLALGPGSHLYVDLGRQLTTPVIELLQDGSSLSLDGVALHLSNAPATPGSYIYTLIAGQEAAKGFSSVDLELRPGASAAGAVLSDSGGNTLLTLNVGPQPIPVPPTPANGLVYSNPNAFKAYEAVQAMAMGNPWFFSDGDRDQLNAQAEKLTAEGAASQSVVSLNLARRAAKLGLELGLSDVLRPGMTPASFTAMTSMSRGGGFGGGFVLPSLADDTRGLRGLELAARGDRVAQSLDGLFGSALASAQAQSLLSAWQPALDQSLAASLNLTATTPPGSGDLSGVSGPFGLPAASAGGDGLSGPLGLRFFGGYLGDFGHRDKTGGYAGYDSDMNGALFGLSWAVNRAWTVGAYGGFSFGETRYHGIDTDIDTDATFGGAFARFSHALNESLLLKLTGDAAYSHFSNDSRRHVDFNGWNMGIDGSFDQDVWSFGFEAALDWVPAFDKASRITPYLNLRYAHLDQDGFSESNGLALTSTGQLVDLGLQVGSADQSYFNSVLGLAYARDFTFERAVLTPRAYAGWDHQYGDTNQSLNSGFNGQPYTYSARSRDEGRDALQAGISLDALFTDGKGNPVIGFKAAYGIEARDKGQDHSIYGGLELRF